MSKEAMKLALEALKQIDEAMPFPVAKLAQAALREALAEQPAQQEPVEYRTVAEGWVLERAEVPAAVWVEPDFWEHCNRGNCGTAYRLPAPGRQPLYTSPPAQQEYERGFIDGMQEQMKRSVDRAVNAMAQRTWVGLNDTDLAVCGNEDDVLLARYWERVCMEKNT